MRNKPSNEIDPALLASDEWPRILLETLPHIAFIIAPGGRAAYYNQRFTDYLGFRPGPDSASRTALHHPDDQATLEAARVAGAAARHEYIVEIRLRRHDGTYRWHRVHNKPLLRGEQVVAWLGTAVDIHDVVEANAALEQRVRDRTRELECANATLGDEIGRRKRTEQELRESESRYRTLYNRTPVALQSVDATGILIDINDTWTEMFGYPRDEALGRSPAAFMTAESAARYEALSWSDPRVNRGQALSIDCQFVARSGQTFDGRISGRGEFDADGRFLRSWSAIADISAEKRAARELQQALRVETMGQLTAGIAHDFNNLLTAILGNLELLARPSDDPERFERLLAGAHSAAERGARLTSQLLTFSRQQRIAVRSVDLGSLLEGMLPLLRSTIGATIDISVETAATPAAALADPTQLELAVMNLAINARDVMPAGGRILITVARVRRNEPERPEEPEAGDYLEVAVSDTGSGIPESVRERIFDPFFTTKEAGKGSGLGLLHVLGVARQLGGGVAVRSKPGEGTRVAIFLPPADQTSAGAGESPVPDPVIDAAPDQNTTILLVDDDPLVLATTASMLRDRGYVVSEATSGAEALRLLAPDGGSVSLLITDVAMPGMTGAELVEQARRVRPDMPVLFITGYAASELLPANGEQEVLGKPFRDTDLFVTVARAMRRGKTIAE
jgi:PAS domain S-box-containing protein